MRASVSISVGMAGETASSSFTREKDGVAGVNPIAPHAIAGVLTARGSVSAGTIQTYVDAADLVDTGQKAVLTWEDVDGNLKHRYNVDCTVADVGSSSSSGAVADLYDVAISGGAGDDLPALSSDLKIALQVTAVLTFDFDDVDTFVVYANVRGVVVFLDATETVKLVVDMAARGIAPWLKSSGFPAPITGTPVTHIAYGSGDTVTTTSFQPKVFALYDATV